MGDKMILTELINLYPSKPGSAGIDIAITGHEQVGPNRWGYRWKQVLYATNFEFIDPPDDDPDNPPLSSELEGYGLAYNSIETNNDARGIEGSGDNLDQAPPNVVLKIEPLGIGAVVMGARLVAINGNNPNEQMHEVIFTAPNNTSGTCSGKRLC